MHGRRKIERTRAVKGDFELKHQKLMTTYLKNRFWQMSGIFLGDLGLVSPSFELRSVVVGVQNFHSNLSLTGVFVVRNSHNQVMLPQNK